MIHRLATAAVVLGCFAGLVVVGVLLTHGVWLS